MYQHEKKNGCRERERGAGPPVWSDSTLGVEIFGHFGWILMRRFFNTCWAGHPFLPEYVISQAWYWSDMNIHDASIQLK
jgi:hypothetical protein